jgi:hypothetical protein
MAAENGIRKSADPSTQVDDSASWHFDREGVGVWEWRKERSGRHLIVASALMPVFENEQFLIVGEGFFFQQGAGTLMQLRLLLGQL